MPPRTTQRPPPPPATGTFRWLQQPDEKGQGGVIRINGTTYLLTAIRTDKKVNRDQPIIGWRLVKADAQVYDVRPGDPAWECDCGDFTFNRDKAATPAARECKHGRALRAALGTLESRTGGSGEE